MLLKTVKEKLFNILNFFALGFLCSMFQIFVLIFLWILGIFIPIAPYIPIAVIYGVIWLGFWRLLYIGHIRWFYYMLVFAISPLLIALMMFDPTSNPMAMIPIPRESIFSSIVTGIILLPIYSILIYKFILQYVTNKLRNFICICIVTILIGSLIFYESWNMMNVIYSYSKFKPFFQMPHLI